MPTVEVEKLKGMKCLLLGAGTLGCGVARALMVRYTRAKSSLWRSNSHSSLTIVHRVGVFEILRLWITGKYRFLIQLGKLPKVQKSPFVYKLRSVDALVWLLIFVFPSQSTVVHVWGRFKWRQIQGRGCRGCSSEDLPWNGSFQQAEEALHSQYSLQRTKGVVLTIPMPSHPPSNDDEKEVCIPVLSSHNRMKEEETYKNEKERNIAWNSSLA